MTKATWFKDNEPVNHVYPDALWNNHNFLFPQFISSNYAGRYKLVVHQMEPKDTIEFIFDVTVIGVPKFKENHSSVQHKICNQTAKFIAELSGTTKKIVRSCSI